LLFAELADRRGNCRRGRIQLMSAVVDTTVGVGPGGVIHDIPNQMHYDGTGPEGATLEYIAIGPAARN
jgi:hypothetical protein